MKTFIFCGFEPKETVTSDDPNFQLSMCDMFQDRKKVFVDRLHWDVPVVEARYEIDRFDNEDAVYIVITDDDGAHLGSVRLLSTMKEHILGDVFPQLIEGDAPRAPDIWEITRLVLSPDIQDMEELHRVRGTLRIALLEYAVSRNIRQYSCVMRMDFMSTLLQSGWSLTPLGFPAEIAGEINTGVLIDSDVAALATARERTGIYANILPQKVISPIKALVA